MTVGLVVALDEGLLGDEGLLQRLGLRQELGIVLRGEVVGVPGRIELQLVDLTVLRDPALRAEEIKAHPGTEGGAGHHQAQGANGAAPEDPQGLAEQHGGSVVSDEPRHHQEDGHGDGGEAVSGLEALPEEGVEEPSAEQGAEGCRAEAEDGAEGPDGRHIPGPLALAAAVEEVGKAQEQKSRGGVEGDEPASLQGDGAEGGVVAGDAVPRIL